MRQLHDRLRGYDLAPRLLDVIFTFLVAEHILRIGENWNNHRVGQSGRDHQPRLRDEGEPPIPELANHELVWGAELGGHRKLCHAPT